MPRFLKLGKDGYWRAQRAVPTKLRALVGKAVWQKFIGSVTRTEAQGRAVLFGAETEQLITRFRALTEGERAEIAAAGGLDKWIASGVGEKRRIVAELPFVEYEAARLPDPQALVETQKFDALLAAQARRTELEMEARLAALKGTARKLVGDQSGTLTSLVDLWKKVRAPRNPATEGATRRALKRFIEVIGDVAPSDVTPNDVRTFRDRLHRDGSSHVTITKSLERLHAVFATGVAEGKLTSNPFYKIKAHGRANDKFSDRRKPFSGGQIKLILSRSGELKPDDAIVTKLLVYQGARPSEICQLRCVDMVDVDGIPAMRLTDEGEDGSLKTAESERTIPIHPACAEEVLALTVSRRAAGKTMLFGYPFVASKGTRSHRFSERFSRWLRNRLKITDKNLVAYSARHTFKDACRAAGLPEYIANQIMGHRLAAGDAGGYGVGVSVAELATWLAKVDPLKG